MNDSKLMEVAREEARRRGHDFVGTAHLLLALVSSGHLPERIRGEIEGRLPGGEASGRAGQLPFAPEVKTVLDLALEETGGPVGPRHLLRALVRGDPFAREILAVPAGIVLAAGASDRMGSPKGELRFGDRTALELCCNALVDGGCAPVVVVLGAWKGPDELPPHVTPVRNERWSAGRSGSMKVGLETAGPAPAYVVLPVDHPIVAAADVRALVSAWHETRPPVVRPVRGGRGGHPVLLDGSLLPDLLALGDDEPLRSVTRANRDRERTVPGSPATLLDLNTPEDYLAARDATPR